MLKQSESEDDEDADASLSDEYVSEKFAMLGSIPNNT
jgi:hypothetical protein